LSRGKIQGPKKENKIAAQKQTAEFKKRHGTVAHRNKIEALLMLHDWGERKDIGVGTSRMWPKFISAWTQALQELDSLLRKEDLQGWYFHYTIRGDVRFHDECLEDRPRSNRGCTTSSGRQHCLIEISELLGIMKQMQERTTAQAALAHGQSEKLKNKLSELTSKLDEVTHVIEEQQFNFT